MSYFDRTSESCSRSRSDSNESVDMYGVREPKKNGQACFNFDDFVFASPDFNWCWSSNDPRAVNLSRSASIKLVERFPDKPWSWSVLTYRFSFVEIDEHIDWPWDWDRLSASHSIPWAFLIKHQNKPWKWSYLTGSVTRGAFRGCDMTSVQILEHFINKDWSWDYLSKYEGVSLEWIEQHLDKSWNWGSIAGRKDLTAEFVDRNVHRFDDIWWRSFSKRTFIRPWLVEKHPDLDWNWIFLSSNPRITPEFVHSHIDWPWEWGELGLSSNPSLSPSFFAFYSKKDWSLNTLFRNTFTHPVSWEVAQEKEKVRELLASTQLNTGPRLEIVRHILSFVYFNQ